MNTRKYPRTMNEAFGPYASGPIQEMNKRLDWQDVVVITGSVIVTLFMLALVLVEVVR